LTSVAASAVASARLTDSTAASATAASLQRVYECRDGATRVLSDRPCGPDSSLRALDPQSLNRYTPVPVPPSVAPAPGAPALDAPARPAARVRKPMAPPRGCQDLQREIDRIDSRMRLGYTGKVGEKLRAQRRQLTSMYASQRCNTTSRRQQK
jgi:hypothetical protein